MTRHTCKRHEPCAVCDWNDGFEACVVLVCFALVMFASGTRAIAASVVVCAMIANSFVREWVKRADSIGQQAGTEQRLERNREL